MHLNPALGFTSQLMLRPAVVPLFAASGLSGYIHYWLILSERSPDTDPLVYWTNGGPGGSGISNGLLQEMGQLHLNENSLVNVSGGVPSLIYNPYNWAKVANTLYVSQPKGVGFSYCDDVDSHQCINSDLTAAQDAVDFFKAFFDGYPEFKTRDFYLTVTCCASPVSSFQHLTLPVPPHLTPLPPPATTIPDSLQTTPPRHLPRHPTPPHATPLHPTPPQSSPLRPTPAPTHPAPSHHTPPRFTLPPQAESYGGIYLPTFMKLMDADGGFPNLKGAAIGDGCWGNEVGLCVRAVGLEPASPLPC